MPRDYGTHLQPEHPACETPGPLCRSYNVIALFPSISYEAAGTSVAEFGLQSDETAAAAMRQTLEVQSQNGRPRWELSALLSVLALLAAAAGAKLGAATQFFHIVHAHAANVL